MSKVKLTKAELAALDALIASYDTDYSVENTDKLKFITAVARVTVQAVKVAAKATPAAVQVATIAIGGDAKKDTANLASVMDKDGDLDLTTLIKLRNEATES